MPTFESIKLYLYGGIVAIILGLGIVIGIQDSKLKNRNLQITTLQTQLDVTRNSVNTLTTRIRGVTEQLRAKEIEDQRKQAVIAEQLRQIQTRDRSLINTEERLRNRPSTSNCPIPKDLENAFNSL